jgi:hypothetical protein
MAPQLDTMARKGLPDVIYLRPLDLSVCKALWENSGRGQAHERAAAGHRFAVRLRAGSGADIP